MNFSISWCIRPNDVPLGGCEKINGWEDVISHLDSYKDGKGSMSLELEDGPDPGPIRISLIADERKYLVTLLESTEDGTQVREHFDPAITFEMIDLLGDFWDSRQITKDFDFVCKLFKDFYTYGDVPCGCLT